MTPLLFVHGFMGSALNWGSIRTLFESAIKKQGETIPTLAFDMLGHARNHPSTRNYAGKAHELLVEDLEKQLEGRRVVAVGHSFGIRPLLMLAQKSPELFPVLIIEDSSPELNAQAYAFLKSVLIKTPAPFQTRDEAKTYFDSTYGTSSQLSRFFISNIRSDASGLSDWRFDKNFLNALLDEALKTPLWDAWRDYTGQLYFIYGEKGDVAKAEDIEKLILNRKPKSLTIFKIDDAGHWIHSDQPERFVETLCKIFDSASFARANVL